MTATNTTAELIERLCAHYGATPEELEETKNYMPTFSELCCIPAICKHTYFKPSNTKESRLQSVLIDSYLLMRLKQDAPQSIFINITGFTKLEKALVHRIALLQEELPLDYILGACEKAGIIVIANAIAWPALIAQSKAVKTMPALLEQMLIDLVEIPKEMGWLNQHLADLASVCQNSFPSFKSTLQNQQALQPREDKNPDARSPTTTGKATPSIPARPS